MASCGSTAGRYWYLRFAWYVHRLGSVPAGAGGGVRAVAPWAARRQLACPASIARYCPNKPAGSLSPARCCARQSEVGPFAG